MIFAMTYDEVERLREVHKPSPVRLGHVPGWFKQRLSGWAKMYGFTTYGNDGYSLITTFAQATGWRLDHWGSSDPKNGDGGRRPFVNEPYDDDAAKHVAIARVLRCDFVESQNSFWCPGSTKRYELRPKSDSDGLFDLSAFSGETYELLDHSNNEFYFSIGAFPTLDAAIEKVDQYFKDYGYPLASEHWDDDGVTLVVNKLPSGLGVPKEVWRRSYKASWELDADDPDWRIVESS